MTPPPRISPVTAVAAVVTFVGVTVLCLTALTQMLLLPLLAARQLPPGWSAGSALGLAALTLGALVLFGGSLYQRLRTRIDDDGVTLPTLRGERRVPWSAVRRVSGRGVQIKLHVDDGAVTLYPLCYARPTQLAPYLAARLPHRGL